MELEGMGMHIHYTDSPELIPPHTDRVIYTPAVPSDLQELLYIISSGIPMMKRSEVLGHICHGKHTLAVAGTHGKTSVSTICAHLLYSSASGCSAFLGGISKNYNTNFLAGAPEAPMVVEADEFDRSFLQLSPSHAVITSMDADHLDIYGTHQAMQQTFVQFAGRIEEGGVLIVKKGLEHFFTGLTSLRVLTYSLEGPSDYYLRALEYENMEYRFDFVHPEGVISGLCMPQPGLMYVENAVAATALALLGGLQPNELAAGLKSFKGVKRRFDLRVQHAELVYIDDYAHHPGEIDFCIRSARQLFPGKELTGIFQPHLYSRTRDFALGFAKSLAALDRIYLLDIYPAREHPIEGVSSESLLNIISHPRKKLVRKEDLVGEMMCHIPEVLLSMGAGDIDQCVEPLEKALNAYLKR
jgi:UDP-N-acetylmuramate--alanine ligase